jgi:hypothetical protein
MELQKRHPSCHIPFSKEVKDSIIAVDGKLFPDQLTDKEKEALFVG